MTDDPSPIEDLLTPEEVAAALRLDEVTLKRWRRKGRGPRWVKVGDSQNSPVRYRRSDVVSYLEDMPRGPAA